MTSRADEIASLRARLAELEGDATPERSPLAPDGFPDLPPVAGVRFGAAAAGVKYQGRVDVMLALCDPGTSVAGVFTRSSTRSAPVRDCQDKLATGLDPDQGVAILVNSGNSNAFTGRAGEGSVQRICAAVATQTGTPVGNVLTASTGVIGERLPDDRITATLAELTAGLGPDQIEQAAQAIMTTDTYAKGASRVVDGADHRLTIAGIAKGSGMIAPDMATMLVYIFTDAPVAPGVLQTLTSQAADRTFNSITVDGDTSTSDTLLVAATGQAGGAQIDPNTDEGQAFANALEDVMRDLAHLVVRDGEGATKFVEIQVTGAVSEVEARTVGLAIANSPLVKTAIAGEDPNWGRVVMAVGKSGAHADRDRLSIWFGPYRVAHQGWVDPDYREEQGAEVMKADDITLRVDLGVGDAAATVWTCDLTHGYISINADYRS